MYWFIDMDDKLVSVGIVSDDDDDKRVLSCHALN